MGGDVSGAGDQLNLGLRRKGTEWGVNLQDGYLLKGS